MSAASVTDIAKELGLSHTTVSLVLNGRPVRVREETRQSILDTARRLHYRPNTMARAMRDGHFRQIGLLLDYATERDWMPVSGFTILAGATDYLAEQDWRLCVFRTDAITRRDPSRFLFTRERGVDALITLDLEGNLHNLLNKLKIPRVSVNAPAGDNTVSVDDYSIGRDGTRRLLELGHRRIVFFTFKDYPLAVSGRRAGYEAVMREAGLAPVVVDVPYATHDESPEVVESMRRAFREECLARHRPTALLVFADYMAYRLYGFIREAGLKIPDDLSVLALDASSEAGVVDPPLSTYRVRFYELGKAAAAMALKLADRSVAATPCVSVGADFTMRFSVRALPA